MQADQQSIELLTNDYVYITNDVEFKDKCTVNRIYVNSDSILKLQTNDQIFLDFGKIELAVDTVGKPLTFSSKSFTGFFCCYTSLVILSVHCYCNLNEIV